MFRSTLNVFSAVGLLLLACSAFALPPVATPPTDFVIVPEDFVFPAPSDLTVVFSDPDGDPMTYTLFSETFPPAVATASVDLITGLVTFTAIPNSTVYLFTQSSYSVLLQSSYGRILD